MNLVLIGKSILDWFNDNMNVSKIKYTIKNIVYVLLWAIISLVSSYNQIIPSIKELCDWDLSSILK